MSRTKTIQTEEAPTYCILRCRQVQQRTGLSRSSIYALIGKEQFPIPVRLSAQSVGWFEHEINGWIGQRSRSLAPALGAPR
jgi:prophage regulatory protein